MRTGGGSEELTPSIHIHAGIWFQLLRALLDSLGTTIADCGIAEHGMTKTLLVGTCRMMLHRLRKLNRVLRENRPAATRCRAPWWRARSLITFSGRHYPREVVLWAVRWYWPLRHLLPRARGDAHRNAGVAVDHTKIYRWVQKIRPELDKQTH